MRFQSELVYWFGQWERGLVEMPNIYTQMIFWDIQTDISHGTLKSIETLRVNLRGFKTSVLERLKNL